MRALASPLVGPQVWSPVVPVREKVRSAAWPEGGRFYRPELDALRFFAFLAVFTHHAISKSAPLLSAIGGYGLSLFFLLSAFLITELLQRENQITGTIALRSFYIRRSLRIWPLYFSFLGVSLLLAYFYPAFHAPLGLFLSFFVFLGNYYVAAHGFTIAPIGILWSLSVEEQFYLCWPVLNKYLHRDALKIVALAVLPAGMLTTVWLMHNQATPNVGVWANILVESEFFACGALLSFYLHGSALEWPASVRWAAAIAGAACWVVASKWCQLQSTEWAAPTLLIVGYLLVAAGCVLLLLALLGLDAAYIPKPLIYFGKISYGLYVFHGLALLGSDHLLQEVLPAHWAAAHFALSRLLRVVLALSLTLALSAASYRFFEAPFLRLKERFAVVRSRRV